MLEKGQKIVARRICCKLVEIQYERSEDLRRGTFRVRGDIIEIYPPYEDIAYRIEMWGDQIEALADRSADRRNSRRAGESIARFRFIRRRTT